MLSNGERQEDYNTLQNQTLINKRNWDMYKDKNHINIGSYYWIANNYYGYLYCAYDGGIIYEDAKNAYCLGIRPVIEMQDGVYIKSGDGTELSPYVLEK